MAEKTYVSPFSPDQTVYHVSLSNGIRKGVVDKIQVVDDEAVQMVYFVVFTGQTKATPITSDLYDELGDAKAGSLGGGALEAYQDLLDPQLP